MKLNIYKSKTNIVNEVIEKLGYVNLFETFYYNRFTINLNIMKRTI